MSPRHLAGPSISDEFVDAGPLSGLPNIKCCEEMLSKVQRVTTKVLVHCTVFPTEAMIWRTVRASLCQEHAR